MMGSFVRSVRYVVVGGVGLALLAGGCSFEDFFSNGEPAVISPRATPTLTPTSTVPPTMTPWIYVPQQDNLPATRTPDIPLQDNLPVTRTPNVTQSATATSTRTPTATRTPTPSPTPSPTPRPAVNLLGSLPTVDDVPDSMRMQREEATLTVTQVAAEVAEPGRAEYLRLLDEWGYRGGSLREFQVPSPGMGEFLRDLLGLEVRALEFGSAEDALAAIDYQREFARERAGWDLNDADIEQLGDASFALTGTAEYDGTDVSVAAIFVQDGNRVYRFVGVGGLQDPFDETLKIVKRTLP